MKWKTQVDQQMLTNHILFCCRILSSSTCSIILCRLLPCLASCCIFLLFSMGIVFSWLISLFSLGILRLLARVAQLITAASKDQHYWDGHKQDVEAIQPRVLIRVIDDTPEHTNLKFKVAGW